MRYSVYLTANAQRNVRAILRHLKRQSPMGAASWLRRWTETLTVLEVTAGSCSVAPESDDHPATIRQVIFKTRSGLPYRAVFTIRDEKCLILHVRGPGQSLIPPDDMRFPT